MGDQIASKMQVKKRNGRLEDVDLNKIVRAIRMCAKNLSHVDPMKVATKTVSGIYHGATTKELDEISIRTAAQLVTEDVEYSKLAARLLNTYIKKDVMMNDIASFSQSISKSYELGLLNEDTFKMVQSNKRKLDDAINEDRNDLFEYFGLKTVYDRYLWKDLKQSILLETPQYWFMRVACGLSKNPKEAIRFYNFFSTFLYLPSSPTLFNSGSVRPQLASCFLLDSPNDSLESIYDRYKEVAQLSKYAGGIGISWSRVRSRGSIIRGTNGFSNGIVPWLKTLDSSVYAVNQGGKRKGATCVYLETWHADIEEFLELRDNTGEELRRTHNLNFSHWIPDEFMRRVEENKKWSLFSPFDVPELSELWGEDFDKCYRKAEEDGRYVKQIDAKELYLKMLRTIAQTGNGWFGFKDTANRLSNQTFDKQNVIHSSNLCTEIFEVTSDNSVAVCNLGSINLANHVVNNKVDYDKLRKSVELAVHVLNNVLDKNFYPIKASEKNNKEWCPIGLGVMGLQDVLFKLKYPFYSKEALELTSTIAEEIYLSAVETSIKIAKTRKPFKNYQYTRGFHGKLAPDLLGVQPRQAERYRAIKRDLKLHGMRNSLLIAIAPTATIASIAGTYECIEPQTSNIFKRETLSGEFVQINRYLVDDLKDRKLWSEDMKKKIVQQNGSVQYINEVPNDIKNLYKTVWEIPQKHIIDMAAARMPYIDQGQSLNLYMETPRIEKLASMYFYAWKKQLKTTYYLRSRPATKIQNSSQEDCTVCS